MFVSFRALFARLQGKMWGLAGVGLVACCLGQNCTVNPADLANSDSSDPTSNQQVLAFTPENPNNTPTDQSDPQIAKVIDANELDTVIIDFSDQAGPGRSYEWKQLEGPSVTITEISAGVASVAVPSVDADSKAILSFSVTSGNDTSTVLVQITIHDLDAVVDDIDFSYSPIPPVEGVDIDLDVVTLSGHPIPSATYSWNFGDGTVSEGAQVKHSFSAGTWTVTLCTAVSVAVSPGCHEKSLEVQAKPPHNRTPSGVTITGFVTLNGASLPGVTVAGGSNVASTVTGSDGSYTVSVASGWTGSLTASLSGYTMTPASIPFSTVHSNLTGKNFVASLVTEASLSLTITGSVQENGTAVMGALVQASNGGTRAISRADGTYTLRVPGGWSGALTAVKTGYAISPGAYNFANVTVNQNGRNFTAVHVNLPPVADAGPDKAMVLDTGSTANVSLDGSASADPDGAITSYTWSEAGNTLATGASVTIPLSLGVHPIQLQVTDNQGATATDTVVVSVVVRANFYVSPSGNDAWTGQLPSPNGANTDGPFKTIQHAVSRAQAGTTILVGDGVYNEQIYSTNQSGTSDSPIVLKAMDGAHPIIDAAGPSNYGIRLFYDHFWIVDGFEIRNSPLYGILCEDATGSLIRNVVAHANPGVGVMIMASSDVTVEWCDCYDNGIGIKVTQEELRFYDGQGNVTFYGTVRSDRCTIRNCMAHDNLRGGGGSDGINYNGGDFGVLDHNLAWQNYDDGIDNSSGGGGSNHASNFTLSYNAAWRNGPPKACPATGYNGFTYAQCMACPSPAIAETANGDCGNGAGIKTSTNSGGSHTIHHNVTFDNTLAGFDNDQESDWGPNKFYNNTAFNNGDGIALDMAGVTSANSEAIVANNVLLGSTRSSEFGGDLRVSGQYAMSSSDYNFIADGLWSAIEGPHSIPGRNVTGDPSLTNPSATIDTNYTGADGVQGKWTYIWSQVQTNFALQPGSRAHDAGEVIPGITDGFHGAAPDMGAIESSN